MEVEMLSNYSFGGQTNLSFNEAINKIVGFKIALSTECYKI